MPTKRQKERRSELRTRSSAAELHTRSIVLQPESWNEETRSVSCVIASENPSISLNQRTGQGEMEVWRVDGAEYDDQIPLLDNHQRGSVANIIGTVRDIKSMGGELVGRAYISEAHPEIITKVREGHIRALSGGVQRLEGDMIQRGQTRSVRGKQYTAPKDRSMGVLTRWRLREASLVPIGADSSAKIRSQGTVQMNENTRKYLESIGLRADASVEDAQAFYDELPEATRGIADKWAPPKAEAVVTAGVDVAKTAATSTIDLTDSQRAEAVEGERKRVKELNRLGAGLSDEVVRKAIDDGYTIERAAVVFLEATRDRTEPATPAIHSRSKEEDCTALALGHALALRNCDGEKMLSQSASYQPVNGDGGPGTTYALRRAYDRDSHKKGLERILNEADRFRSMSLVDIGREACRIDGRPVSLTMSPEEVFRTAVSGSALNVIFTTNINAEFTSGYTDYNDTTVGWTSESDKNNFLTNEVDTMGKFGALQKVTKGRKADHLNTSDWKESYKLARYGGQFVVDEIDFINDRFGALESESPKDMGLTAAQLRPNLVYGLMLANAALDVDGVALFHATHANYAADASSSNAGGPLGAGSLQAAITAMGKQRINGRPLNIHPRFLIVPQDTKFTAGILLKSAERVISTSDGGTFNPLAELGITLVVDDRIGVAGVTDPTGPTARAGTAVNYFLAARPGEEGAKTIEVGYRRGTGRAPVIRSFVLDKGQWGMGWDINFDIGAKALDFRAFYMAKGAA